MTPASPTNLNWAAIPTRIYDRPASWPLNTERTISFFVSTLVFLILAILATVGRFYARRVKRIAWKIDDWFCLAATVIYCIHFGTGVWAIWGGGIGHRGDTATKKEWIVMYKQLLVVQFPYAIEMTLIRLSICILFIRIFIPKWFRLTMYCAMCLSMLWCLFVIITAFTACSPLAANWNRNIPNSHCISSPIFYTAAAAWAVVVDLIIWIAPQTVVWKLQMRLVDKICISLIFALGIADIAISVVRIETLAILRLNGDFIYSDTESQLWSAIEPGVAIVVACAPMMRVIVEKIAPEHMMKRVAHQITNRTSFSRSRNNSVANPFADRSPKEKKHHHHAHSHLHLPSSLWSTQQDTITTRRHSAIDRATSAMIPTNRPTSNCIAKRVSLDSLFNPFSSAPQIGCSANGEASGVKWHLDEKDNGPFPSQRLDKRQAGWWKWKWAGDVVSRTRSRSFSQQFVRVQHDVSVTEDTISPPTLHPAITPMSPQLSFAPQISFTSYSSSSTASSSVPVVGPTIIVSGTGRSGSGGSGSSATGGGTSGLGGDYAENISWPEMVAYRFPSPRSPSPSDFPRPPPPHSQHQN